MKLTPLDIHHKEFRRSIRGYNEEEVDVFLDQVAEEFERFFKENAEFKEQVEGMKSKVKEYEGAEQTLQKALLTGQRAADQVKEAAVNESETIINDAEAQAQKIIKDIHSEKKKVVAELQRLKDAEVQFRDRFQEVLSRFMGEADELKLPTEVEREIESAKAESDSEPQADVVAEPSSEPTVTEEPSEPAMPDEAAAFDTQSEPVAQDIQPPPVAQDILPPPVARDIVAPPVAQDLQDPPVTVGSNPASIPDSSLIDTDVIVDPPVEFETTDIELPDGPVSGVSQGSAPIDSAPDAMPSWETVEPEPAEPEPAQPVDTTSTQPVPPVLDSIVPGSGGGYFDDLPGQPEPVNEPENNDPQVADLGEQNGVAPVVEPELKITLGEPIHELIADPVASESLQKDVLEDLQNQEAPEFDPNSAPPQAKQESTETPASEVVSSFFDDDMGSDE